MAGIANIVVTSGATVELLRSALPSPKTFGVWALRASLLGGVCLACIAQPAHAQFVCGGSANGSEPQFGNGATATPGSPNNFACGLNANANNAGGSTVSNNTAIGTLANASGNGSNNTASGEGADASGNGGNNTATGQIANASGTGGSNTATGTPAQTA
jgi:trimeric autotransporter adhesin